MEARRAAMSGLSGVHLTRHIGTVVTATDELVKRWDDGETVDLLPAMEELTAHSVASFCFGQEGKRVPTLSARLLDTLLPIVSGAFLFPHWFPIRRNVRAMRAQVMLRREISRIVEAHGRHVEKGTLVGHLRGQSSPLKEEETVKVLMGLTLAGHGVPASALCWIWLMLAWHPSSAGRLKAEVDRQLYGDPTNASDLSRLPFAQAVVKEALRLFPPTWLVARTVAQPCELGGFDLQPGQGLLISSYVLARSPGSFQSPTTFAPERWLDLASYGTSPRYAYSPFGSGVRACMGQAFAMAELTAVTAALARRVEFLVDGSCRPTADARRTLTPNPLRVVIRKRPGRGA